MDGLTLLDAAHAAGLAVHAEGDKLVIIGPKAAETVARQLIECKPVVMAALRQQAAAEAERLVSTMPAYHEGWTTELILTSASCRRPHHRCRSRRVPRQFLEQ